MVPCKPPVVSCAYVGGEVVITETTAPKESAAARNAERQLVKVMPRPKHFIHQTETFGDSIKIRRKSAFF
jgi:hypothetical protein